MPVSKYPAPPHSALEHLIDLQCASFRILLGHGMGRNVFNGVGNAGNLIGLSVGDLDGELILNGHDDLDGVEGVETKVVGELAGGANLGGFDLVKVFHDGDDTVGDLPGVNERGQAADKRGLDLGGPERRDGGGVCGAAGGEARCGGACCGSKHFEMR